jgi:hypothetical protein
MADFVFQTVARYGSKKHPASVLKSEDKKSGMNLINTFEIWNEPNLTDPGWGPWVGTTAQYNEMFRVAAQAVKRADPTARVTNGGIAGIDVETVNTLLTPYADNKKPLDFVDILNVHYYSGRVAPDIATNDPNADRSGNTEGARTYEDTLHRLITWRDNNKPGMPIWMTETGYDPPAFRNRRAHPGCAPAARHHDRAGRGHRQGDGLPRGGIDALDARRFGRVAQRRDAQAVVVHLRHVIRELDGVQGGALKLPYPDPNVRVYAWTRGAETILARGRSTAPPTQSATGQQHGDRCLRQGSAGQHRGQPAALSVPDLHQEDRQPGWAAGA